MIPLAFESIPRSAPAADGFTAPPRLTLPRPSPARAPVSRSTPALSRAVRLGDISLGTDPDKNRVTLSPDDRKRHVHVLGGTESGKSTLLEHMLRQDLLNEKRGFSLLDPHGSICRNLERYMAHLPPGVRERLAERVIIFDPAGESDHVVGFNPIPSRVTDIDYTLTMLIAAILKGWQQNTPDTSPRIARRLEDILYPILRNNLTLIETVPLLDPRNNDGRDRLLANITNTTVLNDWEAFKELPPARKEETLEGAGNRLRKFLSSDALRLIIGQSDHSLDFRRLMDEGQILLVNLNGRDRVSNENMKLLGILIVNELYRAAKLRDDSDPFLKPFSVVIDEFSLYVVRTIAESLDELRKFKCFWVLANQTLTQLREQDEYLYGSVMGSAKMKIVMGGLSAEDARIMTEEITPGHLDLKTVKDELYTTKVRHVEETRVTRARTVNVGAGESASETAGLSRGAADAEGHIHTTGGSVTDTESTGENHAKTLSAARTVTDGAQTGNSVARGVNQAENVGLTFSQNSQRSHANSRSDTDAIGLSNTEGEAATQSQASSHGVNDFESAGSAMHFSDASSVTRAADAGYLSGQTSHSAGGNVNQASGHGKNSNESQSNSLSKSFSKTDSVSKAHTEGTADTKGEGRSVGVNLGVQHGQSVVHTDQKSNTHAESKSEQQGEQHAVNHSHGHAVATQVSDATNRTHTETTTRQKSHTAGTSCQVTLGGSESVAPFLKPVEYQELSNRTFYSLDELQHLAMAEIKNQRTAQAFLSLPGQAPVRIAVDRVQPAPYDPRRTPELVKAFRELSYRKHPDCCLPAGEARRLMHERQQRILGEAILFGEEVSPPAPGNVIDHTQLVYDPDNPFPR